MIIYDYYRQIRNLYYRFISIFKYFKFLVKFIEFFKYIIKINIINRTIICFFYITQIQIFDRYYILFYANDRIYNRIYTSK